LSFLSTPSAVAADCSPVTKEPDGPDAAAAGTRWIEFANRNIACGGKVWPVFRLYYGVK
jgi:hypothetical protein